MKKTLLPLTALIASLAASLWDQAPGSPLKPELLYGFSAGVSDFVQGVTPGPGGEFFGVSRLGGKYNSGTFFKVDGSGVVTILADFGDPAAGASGRHPGGRLLYDGSTWFYGVTDDGGRDDTGTIFRANAMGNVETLVQFTQDQGPAPGSSPEAGLTAGLDGNFYGVAFGGPEHNGVIYRISPAGGYEVVVHLTGERGAAPGSNPSSPLLRLPDGSFVGTTFSGGRFNKGVIFRYSPLTGYSVAGEFTGSTGALPGDFPSGQLVRGLDGTVYGGMQFSSENFTEFNRRIWKLPPSGTAMPFVTVKQDSAGQDLFVNGSYLGLLPGGDIVFFADQAEAASFNPALMRVTPAGQITLLENLGSLNLLSSFFIQSIAAGLFDDGAGGLIAGFGIKLLRRPDGGPSTVLATSDPDAGSGLGASPFGKVLVAANGTVFGKTVRGGANDQGTVFSLPSMGALTSLLSVGNHGSFFGFDDNFDSISRFSPLVFDGADLLHIEPFINSGQIQRITPGGSVSTAAEFSSVTSLPPNLSIFGSEGGLVADGAGNFYGRARTFNNTTSSTVGEGIYRLNSSDQLEFVTEIPSFNNSGGSSGPLTLDAGGNIFGVQPFNGSEFEGLIYRVTPGGQVTKFFEFGLRGDASKGAIPVAPLLLEPSGSLLVPTSSSDDFDFAATITRLSASGVASRVLGFTGDAGAAPGDAPIGPLVRDGSGRIFGVTAEGGRQQNGVLYRIDSSGAYTLLHEFTVGDAPTDIGTRPSTGLTLSPDGMTIYGGTFSGGPNGGGTIFRFPIAVQATATTQAVEDITANSATFKATLDSNGYGGAYFFAFGENSTALDQQTTPLAFGGFTGSQDFDLALATLKGHRTYFVQFSATVGAGTDTITRQGAMQSFTTPNGKPRPANDTIIVTAATGTFAGEVLTNDIEPDDDTISIAGFTQGTHGSVSQVGATLVYSPTQAFFDNGGRDSFTYTVTDNFTGAGGPLTETATVDVLSDISIVGDYAGLLFEEQPATAASPLEPQAITPAEIAAGFANIALANGRRFSARFQVGAQNIAVKGTMAEGRGTRVAQARNRFEGDLRATPGGLDARITINGRTLVLRSGQAFAAAQGVQRPVSDFTIRFTPDKVEDPLNAPGIPPGSGFAVVRELKGSRVKLVGVLPDGTTFSRKTVLDGNKQVDFFTPLYKDKSGSLAGQFQLDDNGNIDPAPGSSTVWKKTPQPRDTRFVGGFNTSMSAFGGKYTVPAKGQPPIAVPGGDRLRATFNRGGLFGTLSTDFVFTGAKPKAEPGTDSAQATLKLSARTGLASGKFIPVRKSVKFRGLILQRDQSITGFFLGAADAGRVQMAVVD